MNMHIDSFGFIHKNHVVSDIDHQQLKKQSDKAKRFANTEIKDHPQLESIKDALQVLQPKQLVSVLENTRNAMNGKGERVNLVHQDMPFLAKPASESTKGTVCESARMIELLCKISQLTSESSLQDQLSRLKSYNARMAGAETAYSELADLLESQGEHWANDSDALKAALAESNKLEQETKSTESDLQSAQAKLAKLQAESQSEQPVSPELSQLIKEAEIAVSAAQMAADDAKLAFQKHKVNVLNPAIMAENTSRVDLENTLEESRVITRSMSPHQQVMMENQRKQNNTQANSLLFLISLMSKLIDMSASNDLKAATELKSKLSEAAAKDAENKALEYENSVRKSEEMQKTMGCIGKVLGWVITAVSFAAAAFTGGASLAFAAIGLALSVGDEINQAVNGFSFMAEAFKPLMEAIVQPLMEIMGNIFAQILESFGLDKSIAEMVGQIMGAIAAALVMVAAMVVAGNIASKLSGMVMEKFGSKIMNKVLNNTVGDMMKRIGKGFGQSFDMSEASIARLANYTDKGLTGLSVFNTSVQTAGNIVNAKMRVDTAKIKAHLLNNVALQDILNEMLNHSVEAFKSRIDSINEIVKNIASISDSKMQTGKSITRRMGVLAG